MNPPTQTSTKQLDPKIGSPHVNYYKSFGRPIAKLFLGAVFVYQTTYYIWRRLEVDEIKNQKNKELRALEQKLNNIRPDWNPIRN